MTLEDLTWADDQWRAGFRPDPPMTITQWADRHRHLPPFSSEPGPWRTSRVPYLAGIMDALSTGSPFETVVVQKGAQIGATEILLNALGYWMQHAGGVILAVWPSLADVRRNSRLRVDPLISASPVLSEIVATPRMKSGGNNLLEKHFRGGVLFMTGANSASALSSTPVRFLALDEVDRFPLDVDGEGDPVALAMQRTASFRGRRKIFMASTPTLSGVSRIEKAYLEGDQRRYFVPCRHCGDTAPVTWSRIQWTEGRAHEAFCVCEACGGIATEADKPAMLAGGEWRATSETSDPRVASFHLPGLLSPFESWGEQATAFLASKGDPTRLQTFVNLKLGDAFEDRDTAPLSPDSLQARAEDADPPWHEQLPDGVAVLTAGVDTQNDRLEVEIIGWGRGEESWSIAYEVIHGDPSRAGPWEALDSLLSRRFRHTRSIPDLGIAAVAIDSGGHKTSDVMRYSAARLNRRVWAIKGRGGPGVPPWPKRPPKVKRGGVAPVFIVGVDPLKSSLMARLRASERNGPGVVHMPAERDQWWFAGLVAERAIRRWTRGVARIEWVVDRGVRNEPLDARTYGHAALHGLYATGFRMDEAVSRLHAAPLRTERTQVAQPKPAPKVIRSSWIEGR